MLDKKELSLVETPCYVIEWDILQNNFSDIYTSFQGKWGNNVQLGYSVKTNHLPYMLDWARATGMLAEVVSEDEYCYAMERGFRGEEIIFNGPQKSENAVIHALKNYSLVNIDNLYEINILKKYAHELNSNMKIGLRVNFDLETECQFETTAGAEGSRFGICLENGNLEYAIKQLHDMHLKIKCLHLHYSTKTRSLNVFKTLVKKACEICKQFCLINEIEYIDIGGGFWGGRLVPGKPTMEEYSKAIADILKTTFNTHDVTLILEPGASLVSTAIDYYCKVSNCRDIREKRMVTVDGSLLHMNPFMQDRVPQYQIYALDDKHVDEQIICGATCMERDRLFTLKKDIELKPGDYIGIKNAGAYTLAFNNCFIYCPPCVYLNRNSQLSLLRNRKDINMAWL